MPRTFDSNDEPVTPGADEGQRQVRAGPRWRVPVAFAAIAAVAFAAWPGQEELHDGIVAPAEVAAPWQAAHPVPVDATEGGETAPLPRGAEPATVSARWQSVAHPVPLYAVDGSESAPPSLEVRRRPGGGREDTLTLGARGGPGHARLRFVSGAAEPEPRSFYVDLVRQAAEAGLAVVRSTQGSLIATKFGAAEAASIALAGPADEVACLAFRLSNADVHFSLRGWLCGGPGAEPTQAQLACLIDRVVLTGHEDRILTVLFAQAEPQRTGACGPSEPRVAAGEARSRAGRSDPPPVQRAAQTARETRKSRARRL